MNAPVLEVRGLTVEIPTRAGLVRPVEDVSFDLAPGEILGLVGESGAGKSLTGAALIGLLDPPSRIGAGTIRFRGEEIQALAPSALRRLRGRHIGMIFQDPLTALNPLLSIGDQLTETIRTHLDLAPHAAQERALELVRAVGIPEPQMRLKQFPHEFSGGMRQRAVIALAIAAGPALVIADEPTTALDVSIQSQILGLLRTLRADHGMSMILVSHDMGVIGETCDRVAVMYAGRIVEIGPVGDVIAHSQHPYTRGLMAAIPQLGGPKTALNAISGAMPSPANLPSGCPFHPRCPQAFARCPKERPDLMPAQASKAACWLIEDAAAEKNGEAP